MIFCYKILFLCEPEIKHLLSKQIKPILMKKNLILISFLILTVMSYSIISCQHQIRCEDVNFQISTTHTNTSLNQSDGTITATATGGSGIEFSIGNGAYQSSGSFTNLAAGTYVVHGRNAVGCSGEDTVVISSAVDPCAGVNISIQAAATDASVGQSNGSITATASGGGSSYTYSLDGINFQALGTFTGLAAGSYTVTAQNPNGCFGTTQVVVNTLNPCSGINITLSETHNSPFTGQTNGSITVTPNPLGSYTYSINGGPYQASNTFTNLGAGIYTIVAKNLTGCTSNPLSVTLNAVDPCIGLTITLTETHVNPTSGQSNGSITVTTTPTGTYTYSLNGAAFQTNNTFNNLAAGSYSIVAKNQNGCTSAPKSVVLGSVDPCAGVTITVTTTSIAPTTGQSNGSITATATPAGTYTYSINGVNFQASNVFSGLAAGTYTVTSKNANGCIGSTQVTLVASNPCIGVTINVTNTPTNPTNGANGSITASSTGGTSPYMYSLNGGASSSNATFTALSTGAYTVTATDANGCSSSATAVSLACPPVSASGTPTSSRTNCANNSIACVGANGVAPYTYSINGTSFQTSATITPLAGGTYTITVKDSKGCLATSSVAINAPATVHFATDVKPTINTYCGRANISCHNHNNSWTTYSDIVGSSSGSTWTSNLMTFIGRVRGTNTSTLCVYATGQHNMPPTSSSAWTTFIQGVFTDWVNQGYPNN